MRSVEERFWEKVDTSGDCWIWQGKRDDHGYGRMSAFGLKYALAHRVSTIIHDGPIPKGMCVLHHCDNPACVRPSHLFRGTQSDNYADMMSKGRKPVGEQHWNARLNEKQVRAIRKRHRDGERQMHLADEYGVSRALICMIISRQVWTNVE